MKGQCRAHLKLSATRIDIQLSVAQGVQGAIRRHVRFLDDITVTRDHVVATGCRKLCGQQQSKVAVTGVVLLSSNVV